MLFFCLTFLCDLIATNDVFKLSELNLAGSKPMPKHIQKKLQTLYVPRQDVKRYPW